MGNLGKIGVGIFVLLVVLDFALSDKIDSCQSPFKTDVNIQSNS